MSNLTKQTRPTEPVRADLLIARLCEMSRSQARAMLALGCVTKDGVRLSEPGEVVEAGALIVATWDPKRRYREPKREYASKIFRVVFEDNYLLVVDKAAGFLSAPTEDEERRSLHAAVNQYLSVKSSRAAGASLVHRLDRDTSGLLVFAKHANLAQTVKEQFSQRKPKREYIAVVAGNVQRTKGTFRSFLATDDNLNQHSTTDETKGKLAITHYTVAKRFGSCTFVRVQLETGRRNQIRVHFAEAGHPVLGDVRYRPKLAAHPLWPYRRLALHAQKLELRHPVTRKSLSFSSPTPEEFEEFFKRIAQQPKAKAAEKAPQRETEKRRPSSKRPPKKTDERATKPRRATSTRRRPPRS